MPVVAPTSIVTNAQQSAAPAQPEKTAFGFADSLRKAGEVEPQHTPLTGSQAAAAMREAFNARFGQEPGSRTLSILGAQWALETGGGGAMMNYNFGGIKGTGPSGMSVRYRTTEGSGKDEVHITDRFRAYKTAAEGASDYMAVLEKRFPKAFEKARNGDAVGFVHELKQAHYFTGDEKLYTKIVTDLAHRAENDGWDVLGSGKVASSGKPHAHAKKAEPVAPPPPPPAKIDELRMEVIRMSHALDEAALGIMHGDSPRDWNGIDALLDGGAMNGMEGLR